MPSDTRVLLIGGGAREHALGRALTKNPSVKLHVVARNRNPGLLELVEANGFEQRHETQTEEILALAKRWRIDVAVMGLEDSLVEPLTDKLEEQLGIRVMGPSKSAARIETSKKYLRELMDRHNIAGSVDCRYFSDKESVSDYLRHSDREFAIKPVGLTAGKGVKVMGETQSSGRLFDRNEAIAYACEVIEHAIGGEHGVVIEERLLGEEFTFQCFVDGNPDTMAPMPLVQDYKRAYEGNLGPNTGSMGSYSEPSGKLQWITDAEYNEAFGILRAIVRAMEVEKADFKGVLYGQFILTDHGVRLIETNARFGDPEAMNVLALLECDFLDICLAVAERRLDTVDITFRQKATVCKYIAPEGYPDHPQIGEALTIDVDAIEASGVIVSFAKVDQQDGQLLTTPSRSIALLGVADTVSSAEEQVERALKYVKGPIYVRHDIGKAHLIPAARRVALRA